MNVGKLAADILALLAFAVIQVPAPAQSGLSVTYGSRGIENLVYERVVLENLNTHPADAFHIGHMKSTDLKGNVISSGQYGWGENNNGRSWSSYNRSWTYNFVWGSINVRYIQNGNNLDMIVTTTNNADSGIIFDGASIYPLALNFPELPLGFTNANYQQFAYNTIGPSVTVANYGTGEVVAVVPNASRPLYSGFNPTGVGYGYTALLSGTSPDGLATYFPHNDRSINPGQNDTYTVSLRFAPAGTPASTLAGDAYKSWAATYPTILNWIDRRAIGTVYLASSPNGANINQPGGYQNNPRRYFNDSNAGDFDITTATGLAAFQARILAQAQSNVVNLRQLNAQGVITWDIEGEEYPQATSYVCSPDQIAAAAPEMESTISNRSSPYYGMKLDDAYFKIMTNAGFKVGVCIRPQHFTLGPNSTAAQVFLPGSAVATEIIRKMTYARNRWGATLFYIDSTVDSIGSVLDASIFEQAAAALPDSLLMPEETNARHYAYTAPFKSFIYLGSVGTDSSVYNYYPEAFSAVLVNDVDPTKLAAAQAQLTTQVHQGDILMTHVDYWQENNPRIVEIYKNAGVWTPTNPPTLTPTSVTLSASSTSPIAGTKIRVSANVSPTSASGTMSFYDGSTFLGSVVVASATASYTTSPLAAGTHSFKAVYGGSTSYATSTSSPLAVTTAPIVVPPPPSKLAILSPKPGATVSKTIVVSGQVNLPLDAGGSYLMVDGKEVGTHRVTQAPFTYPLVTTKLTNGAHTLQLWAHDIGNHTTISLPVTIIVGN